MINLLLTALLCIFSSLEKVPDEPGMPSFETIPLDVRQVDLSRNPITYKIVNNVIMQQDSIEEVGYYLLSIKNYKKGYLICITKNSDPCPFYSKNGYDGYVMIRNMPVIIGVTGRFKLHYSNPRTYRTFEMKGELYPLSPYDPKKWWFYIYNGKYKEVDDWTGMEMWTGIYEGDE